MEASSIKKYAAEAFGTCVLTLFGCGSAAVAGAVLGTLGIAFAFGLSIIAMAFVIGNVSGCHINPAVSFGLFLDKRLSGKDLAGYWIAQFIGGIVGAGILYFIISSSTALGGVAATGLGCDGYGAASSVGLGLAGALVVEVILTCIFVLSVLGSTANEKTAPYAGIIIGLTLTFVHIMGIPLTGTSVNPARSFGPALFMAPIDATAISQVWVFIAAPLVGAALAALIWRFFKSAK
ncbi:aquaporin [Raoultibacter phocaeensis]|uniref:aquaporin n=1 Tax=Raoultibacter phocaeensis TaxID=2479841 RepID=UPI001119CE92|nr:aquaporin [Raoultibacter phocaeensis]